MRGILVLVLLLAGCGAEPVALCEDLVDAFVDKAVECEMDGDAARTAVLDMVAGGSCESVVDLRDPKSFTDQCIPWVEALTCVEFSSPDLELHASCDEQFAQ